MLSLIHTAYWQLGKPYGRFDSDVRTALTEARFDAINAIGSAAGENDAAHVLVAGDVFDTKCSEDRGPQHDRRDGKGPRPVVPVLFFGMRPLVMPR